MYKIQFVDRYVSTDIGKDSRNDRIGLFAQFDEDVEVNHIKLSVTTVTLITRIGGIIGVGKEFLWVIIFCITTMIGVFSKIKLLF